MVKHSEALQHWLATDTVAAGIGPPTGMPSTTSNFVGIPLHVGQIHETWATGHGAVRFLPAANGPGSLAHGGAVMTAVVDSCAALAGLEVRQFDLALKRPVPLLETLLVRVEAAPEARYFVTLENAKGEALATSTASGVPLTAFRADTTVAGIDYDELGQLQGVASPQLHTAWLTELPGVVVPPTVHRNPWIKDGPLISFCDGRAEMQVRAVGRAVVAAVAFGRAAEGQPGVSHVGAVGSALDTSFVCLCHKVMADAPMSAAVALTASFQMEVLCDTPLETTLRLDTAVDRIESKNNKHKVFMTAMLRNGETVLASATSLFIAKGPLEQAFVQSSL